MGNLLGRLLVKREFENKQVYVVPVDIAESQHEDKILYLQALYALAQKNISLAICDHYDNMVEMLRYIEKHWPWLTETIEHGNNYIQPDTERAGAS